MSAIAPGEPEVIALSNTLNEAKDIRTTINNLADQAVELERMAPTEMLATAEQALHLAKEANYPEGMARSLTLIGKAQARLGNLPEAEQSLSAAEAMGVLAPALQAEIHNTRGIVYMYLKVYDKAFSCFQRGLNVADQAIKSRLLNNIGEIYREHKDFGRALEYYQRSLQAQEELAAFNAKSVPLANLSVAYLDLNDLENSEHYAREALSIAREQNDQMIESAALIYLGRIAKQRGQMREAVGYFNDSLSIYRSTKEHLHTTEVLLELHKLYAAAGDIAAALRYLHEARRISEEVDSPALRLEAYSELASLYESQGDVREALACYKKCAEMRAAIDEIAREQRLRAMDMQITATETLREKEIYRALNQELDRRARELQDAYLTLQAVTNIGKSITATLNLDRVFSVVYEHLQDLMPVNFFGVGLYDPTRKAIEYQYFVEDGKQLHSISIDIEDDSSFAVACFKRRQGILVNSLDEDLSAYVDKIDSIGGPPMPAMMFQPLALDAEVIGVVSVQNNQEGTYTEKTMHVLEMLSAYLSIAIQNARQSDALQEEIRQREEAQQELQQLNCKLATLSNRDGLTNIANRRRFDEFLQQAWCTASRPHSEVSMLMIDFDYLKEYNDLYGHLAGDDALKLVAQAIQSKVKRRNDLVARYGGDEFVVLLSATDEKGALQVANEVKNELERLAIKHEASPISELVTISIGVATMLPDKDSEARELIARGDAALYQAKEAGRNCIRTDKT